MRPRNSELCMDLATAITLAYARARPLICRENNDKPKDGLRGLLHRLYSRLSDRPTGVRRTRLTSTTPC